MASLTTSPTPTNTGAAASSSAVLPNVAASAHAHMSFLKRIGHLGLDCTTKVLPFLAKEAQRCEPVVNLLFPLEGGVFTSVVNTVCLAEAAGANEATGEQKLQAVWGSVGPQLMELATRQGLTSNDAEDTAKKYIEAIVMILNGPASATHENS